MARKAASKGRPQTSGLASTLAEASWAQADRALAQVLADFSELEAAQHPAKRKLMLALVAQSLQRAARWRAMTRLGGVGAVEAFDPGRHEFAGRAPRSPKDVRILVPGVARGGVVLIKARVASARARARS